MVTVLLPDPVSHYIRRSLADQFHDLVAVRLQQKGVMRLAPDRRWVPFRAAQYIATEKVEFEWVARVRLAPLLWAKVVDAFDGQHGRFNVALWGIIPVAGARGSQIDRGEIQRYLAELPWCPVALRNNPGLTFDRIDDDIVRVWVGDEATYVDLTFDGQGDIISVRSETREREGVGQQPWQGQFEDYAEIGGLRVPLRATVRWETPAGPFEYWRGEIDALEMVSARTPGHRANEA